MREYSVATIISVGIIVFAIQASRRGLPPLHVGDVIGLILIGALFVWLIKPSRLNASGSSTSSESASQGVAFRFGKALNRIWRGKGRSGVAPSPDEPP